MSFEQICSAGEKKEIFIPVPNGKAIKAYWMEGSKPGKTLIVTAGVHGNEYVGIQALQELIHSIRPQELSGRVLIIPVVNESGFYKGTHLVPEDGKNLNRCFPGSVQGSLTDRMAYSLESFLYGKADFILDLHGGGVTESMTPLVFFPAGAGEKVKKETSAAADRLTVIYKVQSYADNGLYSYAAKCQIPALLVERGGGGKWESSEVEACKKNVFEIMDYLKIKSFEPVSPLPIEIEEACYEEAENQGFWYCRKKPGESIAKEEIIGRLLDRDGNIIQTCCAKYDGTVLYLTHALGVSKGDPLIAYGKPVR